MNTANQATPGISLESFWMDADNGCRLFAVDEALWNLGSRRTLWRSERLPVGNGLQFHSLTSCRFAERHAFPRAPFRYPASVRAVLSNNFLEVGYNFLGLAVGQTCQGEIVNWRHCQDGEQVFFSWIQN
jgi:hypothetical protein